MEPELLTEAPNPSSTAIDGLSTRDMLAVINEADAAVALAVQREIPNIATAVDGIARCLTEGGRLFYLGAGTSGRLGVLDASECPPTFQTPPGLVQGIIAGGAIALQHSIEGAEDDREGGVRDLAGRGFGSKDVLVGIAASGRTPYVLGALEYARKLDALTVGVSCTPNSAVANTSQIAITPLPGPEVITGSTRLRAGSATKFVLNMLSTGVMVRLGYVYGNLMVNVNPTNEKLRDRARRIISQVAEVPYESASALLSEAGGSVRVAILMARLGVSKSEAEHRLERARGSLRRALS